MVIWFVDEQEFWFKQRNVRNNLKNLQNTCTNEVNRHLFTPILRKFDINIKVVCRIMNYNYITITNQIL